MNQTNPLSRRTPPLNVCFLIALTGLTFFFHLGSVGLLGPDEPRYAQVAREMMDRGDWVTPTLLGHTWFEKPALVYWLMGLSYRLFGVSEWAVRLPSACLALAGVLWIYWLGTRVHSQRCGFWAAAALASTCFYFGFARGGTFDLPLTVCLSVTLGSFLWWDLSPARTDQRWLWICYIFLGISLLAKGLIGVVLPAGIIGGYLMMTSTSVRNFFQRVNQTHWLIGGGLMVCSASLWYGPVIWKHGYLFIEEFFIAHHFQRYTSDKYHHTGPVYFYLPVMLGGLFPWTLFWLHGFAEHLRLLRNRPTPLASQTSLKLACFCTCWVLFPLLFFSFSGSKLPGYLLPIWPAAALMVGTSIEKLSTADYAGPRRWLVAGTSLLVLAVAVAAWMAGGKFVTDPGQMGGVIMVLGSIGIIGLGLAAFRIESGFYGLLCGGMGVLVVVVALQLFPTLERRESLKHLSVTARKAILPGELITFYKCRKYAPVFYLPDRVYCCDADQEPNRFDHPDDLLKFTSSTESLLVILPSVLRPELETDPRFQVEHLESEFIFSLLRVRRQPDKRQDKETG
ncbi:MAG: glycosyltransferase family 39 protein [Acidobacteria bacterium]|nr:glycosyltransferase family 39 protein [Acidobacteriota bacterium]